MLCIVSVNMSTTTLDSVPMVDESQEISQILDNIAPAMPANKNKTKSIKKKTMDARKSDANVKLSASVKLQNKGNKQTNQLSVVLENKTAGNYSIHYFLGINIRKCFVNVVLLAHSFVHLFVFSGQGAISIKTKTETCSSGCFLF